jgi:hypothetical protein
MVILQVIHDKLLMTILCTARIGRYPPFCSFINHLGKYKDGDIRINIEAGMLIFLLVSDQHILANFMHPRAHIP